MKFSQEDYESLKKAITTKLDRDGMYVSQWKMRYQDQSETRMLWDLYWLSGWSVSNRTDADKYSDAHIETALRRIVKELGG